MINLVATRAAIVDGLPFAARWAIREMLSLDFDFSAARHGLRVIADDDVLGGVDPNWLDLLMFGKYELDGGASPFITIRRTDGFIFGLDVERKEPVFVFNSSIGCFVKTFTLFHEHLQYGRRLPEDFESRARDIDPAAYPDSDWRSLIAYLINK